MKSTGDSVLKRRSIPVAVLLVLVVLLSASSGLYAGASFFAQQAPNVTVTTTILTTTTSWTTSTIWSTMTAVILGVWTTVQYTTSTSTVTVTGTTSYRAAKIVTARGNAQISAAQSKFGGTSGLFHGTGDFLSLADSADWYFSTGDYTIDFWVRFNALPAAGHYMNFYIQGNALGTEVFGTGIQNDGGTYYSYFVGISGGSTLFGVADTRRAATLAVNTWYHIAFVRTGTTFRTFLDGSQLGADYTDADAVPDLVSVAQIGGYGLAGANYLNGWLDEFRISKGIARWTSNFTPSTSAPTGDSNTVLLLHMDGADGSNTFIDG